MGETAGLTDTHWLIGGEAALCVAPNGPTLWLVDLDERATRDRAEAIALAAGEAERHAGRPDAGERLLRDRLVRLLLAAATGGRVDTVSVGRSPIGAPVVVVPNGWHLSVAARWPACLIGIARVPLGVDLERIEPALPPALDLLTPVERDRIDQIAEADQARFFARAWAAKESHAKRFGDPRRIDPAAIDTDERNVVSPLGETQCWRYDTGDLTAAVATDG